MKTFVFQGDSITDSGRSRGDNWHMGYGYPDIVASELSYRRPNEITFINRGVSGDKAAQMYSRIKADTIDFRPDYLSILIGVNDVWHPLNDEDQTGGYSVERYTQLLSMFVEDVLAAKPETVIAILEPFVLDGRATHEKIDAFVSGVSARAKAAKEVAEKYNLIFVPLQDEFNKKLELAPADWWLIDGVHPTHAGHQLIANELIKALDL